MQPRKILVVDDSKMMQKMYELLLRGFETASALDGQQGLETLARQTDVDLILLDVNMPKMSGLEFLRVIKAAPSLRRIPAIIISSEGQEAETIRAINMGAEAYLKKPFGADELLALIHGLEEPGSHQTAGARAG